jgi:glycosyltransferase involved in cell wall biosynthesis
MKLCFVVPRYGEDIVGGAETLCRRVAEGLAARGHAVSVFTTCAVDHTRMENALPPGRVLHNGVDLRRFAVDRPFADAPLAVKPRSQSDAGYEFDLLMREPHPTALYAELEREHASFDLIVPIPYPFAMSMYAAAIDYERMLLWPCLHDEARAYLMAVQVLLRSVRGLLFNTEDEHMLMRRKLGIDHPRGYVVGCGVDDVRGDAARFRAVTGIGDPFLLYAGRLEAVKNVPHMLKAFAHYKTAHPGPLKLVLMGNGPVVSAHPDVIAIGFQPEQAKHDAYAAALALCQPSLHESFSIVMMEAWRAHKPVLVDRRCAVTRGHVVASGGGLAYREGDGFSDAVEALLRDPDARARMGDAGARYVAANYDWTVVLDRFEAAADACRAVPEIL